MNFIITNIKNPKQFEEFLHSLGYKWYNSSKLSWSEISKIENYSNLCFRIQNKYIVGYCEESHYEKEYNKIKFINTLYDIITCRKFIRKIKMKKVL